MSIISKTRKPIATLLIVAMLVSLIASIGVIWDISSPTVETSAAVPVIDPATGVIGVPSSTGDLGTESNPFVLLEIVPSEDMAQMGYLVAGQEPADLKKLIIGGEGEPAVDGAQDELKAYLTDDYSAPQREFAAFIPEDTDRNWVDSGTTAEQYGYYQKVTDEEKADLIADGTVTSFYRLEAADSPYVTLEKITEGTTLPVGTATFGKVNDAVPNTMSVADKEELIRAKDNYLNDNPEDTSDFADDWKRVTKGTGNYSSGFDVYTKGGSNSGEYSLDYKYVGTTGGDYVYNLTGGKSKYVSGYNSLDLEEWQHGYDGYTPRYKEKYDGTTINGDKITVQSNLNEAKGEWQVYFKYVGNDNANGQTTYSVAHEEYYYIHYYDNKKYYTFEQPYFLQKNGRYRKKQNGDSAKSIYYVIFTEDPDGDYVVDGTPTKRGSNWDKKYNSTLYNLVQGATQGFVSANPAKSGQYNALTDTEKAGLPLLVGKANDGTTPIGDFSKAEIVYSDTSMYVARTSEQSSAVGSDRNKLGSKVYYYYRDYDRYTFTKDPDGNGKYVISYTYSYRMVPDNDNGNYYWVGYSYNATAENNEVKSKLSGDRMLELDDFVSYEKTDVTVPAVSNEKIYGRFIEPVPVMFGYGALKNNDILKKYALGLAYKENDIKNGEDIKDFVFVGWYYDNLVDKFNPESIVTKDETIYAKWQIIYEDATKNSYNRVVFDGNKPSAVTNSAIEVTNLPEPVDYVYKGDELGEPRQKPRLEGYSFTGWYTDKEATEKADFKSITSGESFLTEGITLYAGWEPLNGAVYSLKFNANLWNIPVPADAVVILPENGVYSISANGFKLVEHEYVSAEPKVTPSIVGYKYTFAGWYLDPTCTTPFTFGEPLIQGLIDACDETRDYTITLFPKWIPNTDVVTKHYSVTFDANEPSDALYEANIDETGFSSISKEDIAEGISVKAAFEQDGKTIPVNVTLEGNLSKKLSEYVVKVITVTPQDLKISDNLNVINRANLIVINQSCDDKYRDYWAKAHNTTLFPDMDSSFSYPGTSTKKYSKTKSKLAEGAAMPTFADNDISWAAAFRIFKKLAGVDGLEACPVLFDYSIYDLALSECGDYLGGGESGQRVYKNMLYRLYIMTQQMNPVTLYNAYVGDKAIEKRLEINGNATELGIAAGMGVGPEVGWNANTLIPNVFKEEEYSSAFFSEKLRQIGITRDISRSDDIAMDNYGSTVNNRVFVYYYDRTSMAPAIANKTPNFFRKDHYDIQKFLNKPDDIDIYSTGEVLYYLLNNTEIYKNYDLKNLRVLEIEPYSIFKEENYWFWYISRYIPNCINRPQVTSMTSNEVVGYTGDLNSDFDVVYLGGEELKEGSSNLMPSGDAEDATGTNVGSNTDLYLGEMLDKVRQLNGRNKEEINHSETPVLPSSAKEIKVSQIIQVPFYRLEKDDSQYDYRYFASEEEAESYGYRRFRLNNCPGALDLGAGGSSNIILSPEVLGDYITLLELYCTYDTAETSDASRYTQQQSGAVYHRIAGQNRYTKNLRIQSYKDGLSGHVLSITVPFNHSYFDRATYTKNDGWWTSYSVSYSDEEFCLANIYVKQINSWKWKYYAGNTAKVYAGDTVIVLQDTKLDTSNYLYAATGAKEPTGNDNLTGVFGEDDVITDFVYSGNDITVAILDKLNGFIDAGYPVIFDSDLFSIKGDGSVNVNTGTVGQTSNMYRFLEAAEKDSDALQIVNAFLDNDYEKDSNFINCLAKKSFRLEKISGSADFTGDNYIGEDSFNLTFKIYKTDKDSSSSTYSAALFFDINGDGIFDDKSEKMKSVEIKYTYPSYHGGKATPDGGMTRLSEDTYTIKRSVKDYSGIIPWKLVVTKLDSSGRATLVRDELSGACAFNSAKTKITVLQIVPDYTASGTVYFPTAEEIELAYNNNGPIDESNASTYFDECLSPYLSDDYYKNLIRSSYSNEKINGSYRLKINDAGDGEITQKQIEDAIKKKEDAFDVYQSYATPIREETVIQQTDIDETIEQAKVVKKNHNLSKYTLETIIDNVNSGNWNTMFNNPSGSYSTSQYSDVFKLQNLIHKRDEQIALVNYLIAEQEKAWDEYNKAQEEYYGLLNDQDNGSRINNIIKSAGWFYYYTQKISDVFEIEFYRLPVTADGERSLTSLGIAKHDDPDYKVMIADDVSLSETDMIILGCSPKFTDIENEYAMKLVTDYIDAGKSAMFTYDTVSYFNKDTAESWGYNNTKEFRKLLAMDRYHVIETGGQYKTPEQLEALGLANLTLPYRENGERTWDNCYSVGSGVNKRYLMQGLSNSTVNDRNTTEESLSIWVAEAKRANIGQITNYPFVIPETLDVALTHSSYYQLDLEADNLMVWYTLSNSSEKNEYYQGVNVRNNYYMYSYGNVIYSGMGHSSNLKDGEIQLFINAIIASYTSTPKTTTIEIKNKDRSSASKDVDYIYIDSDATVSAEETVPVGEEIGDPVKLIVDGVQIKDESGNDVEFYKKRVHFTLQNLSIVPDQLYTLYMYPVNGNVIDYDHPLYLNLDLYAEKDGTTPISPVAKEIKAKLEDGTTVTYGNKDQATAWEVELSDDENDGYYFDLPITDGYYKYFFNDVDYMVDDDGFALNKNNGKFRVALVAVMQYGKNPTANNPTVGTKQVEIMRRGLFSLD